MEDFTTRTFTSWGVGQKAKNNGVILFVFPKSHKMRLEVGYGLEGVIPDATAKSIITHEITPAFRAGNFDGGVTQGIDAVLAAARGEYQATDHTVAVGTTMAVIFLFFVGLIVLFGYLVRKSQSYTYDKRGRRRHTTGWGTWLALAAANSSSSSSSGSWSSSSSSSGGFSGGGGDCGGGGASGSW